MSDGDFNRLISNLPDEREIPEVFAIFKSEAANTMPRAKLDEALRALALLQPVEESLQSVPENMDYETFVEIVKGAKPA